jgi:preprotein translocase subunit SecD
MITIPLWQRWVVLVVCLIGFAFAVPSLMPRESIEPSLPGWMKPWFPHKQVTLGLDLQGGSHLLLEVDHQAVLRERLRNMIDAVRQSVRQARIGVVDLREDGQTGVSFRVPNQAQIQAAVNAVRDADRAAPPIVQGDRVVLRLNEQQMLDERRRAVAQSIAIVRRRIDETGARDPTIQGQGADRILVQLPGVRDPERIKALLGRTARMNFHFIDPANSVEDVQAGRAPGSVVMPGEAEGAQQPGQPAAIRQYVVERRVRVAGDRLTDAQPSQDSRTGEWIVNFTFDSLGGRQFGDATRANVGRLLAIVLDNRVISAPVIREPILGGRGQISGSFTAASANDLAVLLRAGALPAPLTVVEERTVGPDLGSDSIRAGAIACILGFILVAVLMIVGYGLFGIVANVALVLNLAFTLSIMTMLDATLTLPGIAGMVLGLAMAVDANVLLYERMREETAAGRSPFPAVDVSFQRAYVTILDSNLTTLIASLFLYAFGTGPVRGFAVTLSIGIACSMFTSVTATRVLIVAWLRRYRPAQLPL